MSTTAVGICNMALAALGAELIRSFEENNKRARLAEILYKQCRNFLLSQFDWPFARGFATLHRLTDLEDMPEGKGLYALPNDCIRPRDLHPIEMRYPWEQVGKSILIDESDSVFLYYTKLIEDSAQFSEGFITALAAMLTWKLAPSIVQDKALTKEHKADFYLTFTDVLQTEANIGSEHKQADDDPNNDTFVNPSARDTYYGDSST